MVNIFLDSIEVIIMGTIMQEMEMNINMKEFFNWQLINVNVNFYVNPF